MHSFRYSHMVHEYNLAKVREIMQERHERLDRIASKQDAEQYIINIRHKLKGIFGPFPEKTPLNAETTGVVECKHFNIENILFQSRPGLYVTGNLYLPKNLQKKNPAALVLCGHDAAGKHAFQDVCQTLAMKGFITFIIDPISQGERRQFFPRDGGKRPRLILAHNLLGNKMLLTDDFFGSWRVWDAVRALDYLLSRPEVDPNHIGVTGHSGGGTLTSYLSAIDSRITMAAPNCYICSIAANVENECPTDAEQNPPGFLKAGLDHVDLLLAHAPRPTLILGQYHDFFSSRYTLKAAQEMKRIYKLLGREQNTSVFIGPREHSFQIENREAMVAFFMKQANIKGDAKEKNIRILPDEKLYVTKSGTLRQKEVKRVFEFTAEQAEKQANCRPKLTPIILRKKIRRLLQIDEQKTPPHYRVLHDIYEPEFRKAAEFAIETEPGIQVIAGVYGNWKSFMHPPTGKIRLYIGHISSQDEIKTIPRIRKMVNGRIPLVAADPRGIGQSTAKSCATTDFFHPYGAEYMYAAIGDMTGSSYLGQRVFDVLRTLDFLYAEGAEDITLIGRGLNSITVAFAAVLHKRMPKVELINYLPSYQTIIESPIYKLPLSAIPRGILKHFDLPDIYEALGARLKKEKPWNAKESL